MDEPFELNFENYAVWWAMTWPAVLASIVVLLMLPDDTSINLAFALLKTTFVLVKTLLIKRAFEKEYRTFWIGVVRGEEVRRTITWQELRQIAYRHTLSVLCMVLILDLCVYFFGWRESLLGSSLMLIFLPNLVTTDGQYRGFRLQGYRRAKAMPHQTAA